MSKRLVQILSGKMVDIFADDPGPIPIDQIAHSLSLQCRYTGHCKQFYSVAEHSILICDFLVSSGYGPEPCMIGLMHDAAEALTGDLSTPIKKELGEKGFTDLERKLTLHILDRIGIKRRAYIHWEEWIKAIDRGCRAWERQQLMNPPEWQWEEDKEDLPYFNGILRSYGPLESIGPFLNRYENLKRKLPKQAPELRGGL